MHVPLLHKLHEQCFGVSPQVGQCFSLDCQQLLYIFPSIVPNFYCITPNVVDPQIVIHVFVCRMHFKQRELFTGVEECSKDFTKQGEPLVLIGQIEFGNPKLGYGLEGPMEG